MYGAIIGDLAGSIYEFDQTKKISSIKMNNLIEDNAFFSDDTILTIAIIDAIVNNKDYSACLKKYINNYKSYKPNFSPYFEYPFSPKLMKWARGNYISDSKGNGAMMRISPIGYLFDNEEEILKNTKLATSCSHNSREANYCAFLIAKIIFNLRCGLTKEEVFNKLHLVPEYKRFDKFNTTCFETINNCLYAFYHSNSFNDAIKNTLAMGGDTDTNCCIVGSLSEALYGIDNELITLVNKKIPDSFVDILEKGYERIRKY